MKLIKAIAASAIFGLSAVAALAAFHGSPPVNQFNNGGMQIGRNFAAYYVPSHWINQWQQGDTLQVVSSLNGTVVGQAAWNALGASGQPYFNSSTGELNTPVQSDVTSFGRGVFKDPALVPSPTIPNGCYGPGCVDPYLGSTWTLSWQGSLSTAATKITNTGSFGSGGSPGLSAIGANSATVTMGTTGKASNLALFFVIDASNAANPPNHIKFYQTKYATQAASSDPATANTNPDWLAQYGGYGKTRWMSELGGDTNINGITDFSQLADLNYNSIAQNDSFPSFTTQTFPAGFNNTYGPKGSVAPSAICIVQNKTGAHPHYNLPMGASNLFASQLATAFNGCMANGLTPFFEFCNEIWNFGGNFECFPYTNRQPWPPLGASAPYQQSVSIASITPGSTTTITCTPNCGALANGNNIGFQISSSDTIFNPLGLNLYQVANCSGSPCPSFTVSANTTGLSYSSGGITFTAGSAVTWGGYRSAQLMQQIHDAYGAGSRSRWKGVLGAQVGNSAVAVSALVGVNFYLANEAPGGTKLADLYDEIDIAPYYGNTTANGIPVTGITIGATPTITFSCSGSSDPKCPTNGETLRIYAATGMTQINNMTATLTCSPCTSSGTININTTGFSAWVTADGNFMMDNTLPKMVDDSVTNNTNTPATYPTKYSYFAQEMSDSIINGTSTNAGYVTGSGGNFLPIASCAVNCLPAEMTIHALIANENGLALGEYEGGNTFAYVDTNGHSNVGSVNLLYDFIENWQYDAGTATFGPAKIAQKHFAISQALGVAFPAQFLDFGPGPAPFNGARYFGDNNPVITATTAQNALGPCGGCTVPTPSIGTCTMLGNGQIDSSNHFATTFSSTTGSSGQTLVMNGVNIGATPSPYVLVGTAISLGGATASVNVGGVNLSLIATFNNGGVISEIWGGIATGLSGSQTVTVTFNSGTGFRNRSAFVVTTANLLSQSALAFASGINNITLNETKGGCVFAAGYFTGTPNWNGTSGVTTPSVSSPTTALTPYNTSVAGQAALFSSNFSSQLFNIAFGGSGGSMSAVQVR